MGTKARGNVTHSRARAIDAVAEELKQSETAPLSMEGRP
jgi:hypothetical protein